MNSDGFLADASAVSEVVGYMLGFGILSMVFMLAILAFNDAADEVREDATILQADALAQRVASAVVEASLYVEKRGSGSTYLRIVESPEDIEGRAYEVRLRYASGSDPDRVEVAVPSIDHTSRALLFAAGAPPSISLCASEADGPFQVRFDTNPGLDTGPDPDDSTCIFLEQT